MLKRRSMLGMVAGAAGLGSLLADQPAAGVNRNSAPSQLRITDMRAIRIASNYDYPIIHIDTNQGVYGLGEVRDAGNEGMALVLKPHIVGRNPLNIEPILDSVRNFTNQRRFGGGYSALDIALHDISGKVFGVPAWRLIGSQYRDRIRCYCDTTESERPEDIRRADDGPQEGGVHLLQDGHHARHKPEPFGRVEYPRRGYRKRASKCTASTFRPCATPSAGISHWRPITSALWM